MTSELRPASEVWSIACGAYEDATADLLDLPMRDIVVAGDAAAAAVIEADREAVRAEVVGEIVAWLRNGGNWCGPMPCCLGEEYPSIANEIEAKFGGRDAD